MRALRILGLTALVAFAANCGGGDGGSHATPGFLKLNLNTPNANDGAILVKVTGGVIDSVVGGSMAQSMSYTIQPSYTRIVVAGNIVDGVIARIQVPDIGAFGSYSVTVEQAAVRNTFTQQALSSYSVSVIQ